MRLTRPAGIAAFNVLILIWASGAATAAPDDTRPDLSGTWQLNEGLSDDVALKMREAMEAQRSQMMGGAPGDGSVGGMGGGRPGGMGGRGAMGGPGGLQARLAELEAGTKRLVIVHEEPELSIEMADGQTRRYFTDNRKQQVSTEFGKLTSRAKWKKNGQIVVRSSRSDGPEITQIYQMDHDGARLTVTTRLEGQGPGVTFQRVYERGEAAEPE
jgi:hypothetical protein